MYQQLKGNESMSQKIKLFFRVTLKNGGAVYARGLNLKEAHILLEALQTINIECEIETDFAEGV